MMPEEKSFFKRIDITKLGPLVALAILFVISAFASPYFLQVRNLLNILSQVSFTGMIALGMTFIIISGGIDLSVGSAVAFSGGVMIIALNGLLQVMSEPLALLVGFLVALGVGIGCGALNGLIVTKGRLAPFIATLGTMAIFRSLILFFGNAGNLTVDFRYSMLKDIGRGRTFGVQNTIWVFLILTIILQFVLNKTRYGRYVCAVGSNEKVAKFSSIKVDRVRFMTYVITGATVAFAAFFAAGRMNSISTTQVGDQYELDAIAAVVIGGTPMTGGTGIIWGTVVGAIILGMISNMLNMVGVSPYLHGTVKGIVIIGAVLVQEIGKRSTSKLSN